MAEKLAVGYLYSGFSVRLGIGVKYVCKNLVHVSSTIGELPYTEWLQPVFLNTFR